MPLKQQAEVQTKTKTSVGRIMVTILSVIFTVSLLALFAILALKPN